MFDCAITGRWQSKIHVNILFLPSLISADLPVTLQGWYQSRPAVPFGHLAPSVLPCIYGSGKVIWVMITSSCMHVRGCIVSKALCSARHLVFIPSRWIQQSTLSPILYMRKISLKYYSPFIEGHTVTLWNLNSRMWLQGSCFILYSQEWRGDSSKTSILVAVLHFWKGMYTKRMFSGPFRALKCSHFKPQCLWSCSGSLCHQNCHEKNHKRQQMLSSFQICQETKLSRGHWSCWSQAGWHKDRPRLGYQIPLFLLWK